MRNGCYYTEIILVIYKWNTIKEQTTKFKGDSFLLQINKNVADLLPEIPTSICKCESYFHYLRSNMKVEKLYHVTIWIYEMDYIEKVNTKAAATFS